MPLHLPRLGKARRSSRSFSLIELLVVVSIMALLAVATLPALRGTLNGMNLKGGANSLVALLDLARQTASTRNLSVDVRLYQDTAKPKDSNGNYPYRFIEIVIPASASGAASDEFLTQPLVLPGDVIIDSDTKYSSMLDVALGATGLQPVGATELTAVPYVVRNLPYIKFTYLANGTMNLDPSQQWCLTLLNQNVAAPVAGSKGPAANFVALVFDVQTSRARVYQP